MKLKEESIILKGAPFQLPEIPSDSPLVKEFFQVALGGKAQNPKHVFKEIYKTLTSPRKEAFLKKERDALQGFFKALYPKLLTLQSQEENFWAEALTGQFFSYFTFFGPFDGEEISLPIYKDGTWHLFDYTVEKIPLSPSWMGSQSFAFGLTPKLEAPPLLLFKGTSYPTDEGFGLQLLTDFNPLASVGSYLFWLGRSNIEKWLKKSSEKARVFGLSLGGALTLHTALHFSDLLENAFAYNTPALLPWEVRKSKEHPGIHVFCNENDLSSDSGFSYGKGWNVYKVLVDNPPSFLLAHVQCYLGRTSFKWIKIEPKKTVSSFITASLHLILPIPLFFVGSLVYALTQVFKRKKL